MNNKKAYNTGCHNKCFTSIHCIDGSCPSAQYESICSKYGYDLASDMGLQMIRCSKCCYNTQQCTDCIFENTEDCYMHRKEKDERPGQAVNERTKTHACVCISKQQAIDAVCRWGVNNERNGKLMITMTETKQSIVDLLDDLPPVQPQPKIGRWIGHREHCENLGVMPSGLGAYEWCSNCNCGIDVREWHRNHYNFCPNCGANMEMENKDDC